MSKTTFILFKPDANLFATRTKILDLILARGFKIKRRLEIAKPTQEQVEAHLKDLRLKNFSAYTRNVAFLLAGPVVAMELELPGSADPVGTMRELVGPTDPVNASNGNIRKMSSDSIVGAVEENRVVRNLIHAADSDEAAVVETLIWFGASTQTMTASNPLHGGTYSLMRKCCGERVWFDTHEDGNISLECRVCKARVIGKGREVFEQWNRMARNVAKLAAG